ncbi:ras guanine nucleotide exchange factor domain-containing protein [Linnemannia elongata]|nr:ras guanine nucleotide exchange factor domain-containing protein [Linnemannia elongata]
MDTQSTQQQALSSSSSLQGQNGHIGEQQQQQTQQQTQQPLDQQQQQQEEEEDETEPFVVVRALYPFHSEEPSSLSFEREELIQVLTQLDSGWWYGFCHGEHGWFPSNYVEEVTQDELDLASEAASDDEHHRQHADHSDPGEHDHDDDDHHSSDGEEEEDNGSSNGDFWLPQTTPDGQVFYVNTNTGESSWTIPTPSTSRAILPIEEQEDEALDHTLPKSLQDTNHNNSSNSVDASNRAASSSTTPTAAAATPTATARSSIDAAAESDTQNHGRPSNLSILTVAPGHDPVETESQGDSTRPNSLQMSAIPTRAGSPISPWPEAPGLRRPSGRALAENAPAPELPPLPTIPSPFNPEPTWESLADYTNGAIQNLLYSAENGFKGYFQIQATQVVEAIRVMLYASGTVDKDSSPIRMHPGLKLHHRQIMAALSKLILSAKMASGVWPAEGAVSKMLSDANDVAQSVHHFILMAQGAGVTVHDVDAKLIVDPESSMDPKPTERSNRGLSSRASMEGGEAHLRPQAISMGLLNQLDYYSKSSCRALSTLSLQLRKAIDSSRNTAPQPTASSRLSLGSSILNSSQSSQMVNQCQQSISQLGSLLSLVGEFYTLTLNEYPSIEDQYFMDVRASKQTLYNNIAALVMSIQLATDPMVQTSVLEMALEATTTAERSTMELVALTRSLAMEKDEVDKQERLYGKGVLDPVPSAVNLTFNASQRQTEIDSYFQEQGSDMDGSTLKNSRLRSNSQVSTFSSASSASNISAPTTPGTEYTGRSQANAYPFPSNPTSERSASPPPPVPALPTAATAITSSHGSQNAQSQKFDTRGHKVKKMLGDEAPAPAAKPKVQEQPWYLGHDYSPADISFNMEGHVRGGTLPALVERLTLHDGPQANFVANFMLTYRSFATTEELFALLFRRFTISPPMGLDESEMEEWTERKLTPIRLRVFNIIKSWLENYYLEDEVEDRQILPKIKEFSESGLMKDTLSFAAVQLIKLVEKREVSDGSLRKMVLNLTTQAPQPITPRNLKRIKFLELDPLEFARQLTIMEANYFNKIKPIECLAKAWMSDDPEIASKAANIKKMIETSNLFSNWIDEIVLSEKDPKKRAAILRHLITVAEKLRQLNNFSMLSATTAALSHSPIHRLKRTWELVPNKYINSLAMLQALTSSAKNWAEYRAELHSVNPPCVPFVGIYLTDLVMIEDGNPDILRKTDNHINFYKRVSTAEVIREIQQYQSVPYCLTMVPEIQAFIRRGMDNAKGVTELYDMSLALEPR